MKYEAVFGDQGLFFDAHSDCEMAGNGHYKVENGKLMVWNFAEKRWCNSHTNTITISAMRRIIAEPKRWTVADQKAGRLPEVGGECRHCRSKLVKSVIAVTATHIAINENNSVGAAPWFLLHDEFMQYYIPIETPEEKAQQEEDEFISSLSGTDIHDGTIKDFFAQGARAAYRKLKGGE